MILMRLSELVYGLSLLDNKAKHRIIIVDSGKIVFNENFIEFVNKPYLVRKANNITNKLVKQLNVAARDSNPISYDIVAFVK